MNYSVVKLKDCCTKIGSGATPKGGKNVYVDHGVSQIRSQNVRNLDFDYSGLVSITEEAAEKLRGVIVYPEDVLLNITGDSVARVCHVPNNVLPARVNQHVAIVRTDSKRLDADFLAYYLASPYMQSYMLKLANGKGVSRNALTKDMIGEFEVPCPDLEAQRRIVDALKPYDDLIENNRKQIKLLEEAAQRLYKEWFIDLKFPGHENVKVVNGVPEGWNIRAIGELCGRIQSGSTPSRKNSNYWSDGNIRWFKTQELQDCWLIDSDEKISNEALERTSVKLFPANSILMAIYASPTLGRLGILYKESTFNQAALAFVPRETISKEWLYCKLFELRSGFNAIARGAGQQNISGAIVKEYEIVLPPAKMIKLFTDIVQPLFEQRLALQLSSVNAAKARDQLLPKLMSGEIEV